MKTLNMIFLNEEEKKVTLKPKVARDNLSAEEVKQVMDDICSLGLFEKNGIHVYHETFAAKYTETIVTPLF